MIRAPAVYSPTAPATSANRRHKRPELAAATHTATQRIDEQVAAERPALLSAVQREPREQHHRSRIRHPAAQPRSSTRVRNRTLRRARSSQSPDRPGTAHSKRPCQPPKQSVPTGATTGQAPQPRSRTAQGRDGHRAARPPAAARRSTPGDRATLAGVSGQRRHLPGRPVDRLDKPPDASRPNSIRCARSRTSSARSVAALGTNPVNVSPLRAGRGPCVRVEITD